MSDGQEFYEDGNPVIWDEEDEELTDGPLKTIESLRAQLQEAKEETARVKNQLDWWGNACKEAWLYRDINADEAGSLRAQLADLTKERDVYRATLEHISKQDRCSNPRQCAQEALDGDWKGTDECWEKYSRKD